MVIYYFKQYDNGGHLARLEGNYLKYYYVKNDIKQASYKQQVKRPRRGLPKFAGRAIIKAGKL